MALSTSEVESLRLHLGYGNLSNVALPYTPDGWWEVFGDIVSDALGTGTEDASTTAVTAGSVTTITLTDASEFVAWSEAVIDVGDDAEIVIVKAQVTGSGTETITAKFAKAHSASGYPVATISGKARLRMLLHDANKAWVSLTGSSIGAVAGLKSVDKGDVVWQDGGSSLVLSGRRAHYMAIVNAISQLVRVPSVWNWGGGGVTTIEAY